MKLKLVYLAILYTWNAEKYPNLIINDKYTVFKKVHYVNYTPLNGEVFCTS